MRTIEQRYDFWMSWEDMIDVINKIKNEWGENIQLSTEIEYGYYDDVSSVLVITYTGWKE